MTSGHGGGDDLAVVIHTKMQFLPTLALLLTMFLGVPFALTAYLYNEPVKS